MPIRPENRHRYPKNWHLFRRAILERAENRCECQGECGSCVDRRVITSKRRCDRANYEVLPGGTTVVLTIAHLDHTPENNEYSNLRAYCQRCHLAYDREHHAKSRRENRDRDTGQESLF